MECRNSNVQMSVASLIGNENVTITDALFCYLKECKLYNRL